MGQVLRHLTFTESVDSERLYGVDIQAGFIDLGYELFKDREKFKGEILQGDILADEDQDSEEGKEKGLERLRGKIDVVHAAYFFHLFERAGQVKAAKRVVGFLDPDNQNVVVFGCNGGPKVVGWEKYVLNKKAWQGVWDEVGETTGTAWRTEMHVEETQDTIKVSFAVYRAG